MSKAKAKTRTRHVARMSKSRRPIEELPCPGVVRKGSEARFDPVTVEGYTLAAPRRLSEHTTWNFSAVGEDQDTNYMEMTSRPYLLWSEIYPEVRVVMDHSTIHGSITCDYGIDVKELRLVKIKITMEDVTDELYSDAEDEAFALRMRAVAKLTKEEVKALGLEEEYAQYALSVHKDETLGRKILKKLGDKTFSI